MTPGIQVISESREAEGDRSLWKIIILGLLGAVASVAAVSGFNNLLVTLNQIYFWPTIIVFSLFLVFVVLQVFLVKGLGKLTAIALVEAVAPLAIFWGKLYPQPSMELLAGAALLFVFLFVAVRRGRSALENGIKLKFFDTSRTFLPKAATGFLVFACVLLYLNYFQWGNFTPAMGRQMVTGIMLGAEPVVQVIVPGISFDVTVRELLTNLAREQLLGTSIQVTGVSGQSPETNFRALPQKYQDQLTAQAADQLQGVMESRFGSFDPNEKITDFAYNVVDKYVTTSLGSSPWILPGLAVLLFFLTVKGIMVLFYWLFALIAFVIFKLLFILGITSLQLETRSREFVIMP